MVEHLEYVYYVLILILLEYALWEMIEAGFYVKAGDVLILILLEYALWEPIFDG